MIKKYTFFWGTIIVLVIWVPALFFPKSYKMDAVSALISGLAFAGFLSSMQKQQTSIDQTQQSLGQQEKNLEKQELGLAMQRKDLKLQRKEMKLSRKEMISQNETLKIQKFENTFFNMLTLHRNIVSETEVIENNWKGSGILAHSGRDAFKRFFELITNLNEHYDKFVNDVAQNPNNDRLYNLVDDLYIPVYDKLKKDFGHYYRNIYRIIKIVDETQFSSDQIENFNEKYRYISILRAQLSDYELLILFFNCLSYNGVTNFKPLVEKYSLFKNIPEDEINSEVLSNLYAKSAFNRPINIPLFLYLIDQDDFKSQLIMQFDEIFTE